MAFGHVRSREHALCLKSAKWTKSSERWFRGQSDSVGFLCKPRLLSDDAEA
jgi:hypothetical protein